MLTLRHHQEKGAFWRHEKHTCINHTESLSPWDIALQMAAPRDEIYAGSFVGGEFSLKVSLHQQAVQEHERNK